MRVCTNQNMHIRYVYRRIHDAYAQIDTIARFVSQLWGLLVTTWQHEAVLT